MVVISLDVSPLVVVCVGSDPDTSDDMLMSSSLAASTCMLLLSCIGWLWGGCTWLTAELDNDFLVALIGWKGSLRDRLSVAESVDPVLDGFFALSWMRFFSVNSTFLLRSCSFSINSLRVMMPLMSSSLDSFSDSMHESRKPIRKSG